LQLQVHDTAIAGDDRVRFCAQNSLLFLLKVAIVRVPEHTNLNQTYEFVCNDLIESVLISTIVPTGHDGRFRSRYGLYPGGHGWSGQGLQITPPFPLRLAMCRWRHPEKVLLMVPFSPSLPISPSSHRSEDQKSYRYHDCLQTKNYL
jgi:hypothetical protein